MPAARYWRAIGLQTYGGAALELSALHLYLSGVRVDASATLSSAIAPVAGSLANLQDTDAATVCRFTDVSAPGFALVWDFGVGVTQDVAAVRLGSGALQAEFAERLTLQFSSDGANWTGAGSVQGLTWPGANIMQSVPADGDYYYQQVAFLLHCDGSNGSTTFTDSSPNPKTIYSSGNVKISTAQTIISGACAEFDGNGDYLTITTDMPVLGVSDFCAEVAIRVPSLPFGSVQMLLRSRGQFNFELNPNGSVGLYLFSGGLYASGGSVAANTNTDISLVRRSGTFYVYVNGVQAFSLASPVNLDYAYFDIGYDTYAPERAYLGWMDEIRMTLGSARYYGNYTPRSAAGSHTALGAIYGTALLRTVSPLRATSLSGGMAGPAGPVLSPAALALDQQDAGRYRIYGTVELAGTPNLLLRRRVQLWNQRDKRMVRETWSDATTGAWSFDYIRGGDGTRYCAVTYDHTGQKQAQIADNLEPEAM